MDWEAIYDLNNYNINIYELINGNGFQKIYKIYRLEFEGEFLNGIKNGKGKEYFDATFIFESEKLKELEWKILW